MGDAKRAWEERWGFDGIQRVMSDDWAHPNLFRLIAANGSPEELAEAAKLAAAAPLLVRALLSVEWSGPNCEHEPAAAPCPACIGGPAAGHAPTCRIHVALTAAGLPDQASRDEARARMARSGR